MILGIVGHVSESRSADSITAVIYVILPVAAIVVLVRRIVEDLPSVSARTILGLLSVYLLMGMTFAALFATIAVISDEPFFAETKTAEPVDFTYFSFVTLSTVGYGDFTAANPMPRMLSAIEGLMGQLYLVTVVAVAVSRVRPRRESTARGLTLSLPHRRLGRRAFPGWPLVGRTSLVLVYPPRGPKTWRFLGPTGDTGRNGEVEQEVERGTDRIRGDALGCRRQTSRPHGCGGVQVVKRAGVPQAQLRAFEARR